MRLDNQKASILFRILLWGVSCLAFIQNIIIIIAEVAVKKIINPKIKLAKFFASATWNLGRSPIHYSSPLVDWFNPVNHLGKVHAASSKVLSVFYNFDYEAGHIPFNGRNYKSFWIRHMNNSRGVTNRKKIIVECLTNILRNSEKQDIKLVSLASGSAEAVLEAIAQVPGKNIQVTLIDSDPEAIARAKENVAAANLTANFSFVEKNILMAVSSIQEIDVIEMAGFCDYLNDDILIKMFRKIKAALAPNGHFVTCNIIPNNEKIFLDWVLLWPMKYRTIRNFQIIMEKAGFSTPQIIVEPLKVHVVGIGKNE